MTRRPHVLVIGAHPLDGFSMERFSGLTQRLWDLAGADVVVLRPKSRLGPRLGKWGIYADKYVLFLRAIRKAAATADVVHIAQQGDGLTGLLLRRPPNFTTVHDLFAQRAALGEPLAETPTRLSGRVYQSLNRRGLRRSVQLLADSSATVTDVRSVLGRAATLVNVPIDEEAFPSRSAPRDSNDPYFLLVASDSWYKQRSVALRIFTALRSYAKYAEHRLTIVGPPLNNHEVSVASELGLFDAITVMTGITDATLSTLYRSASAVVVSSSIEGFGWPYLEAQLHGTPLVAVDNAVARAVAGDAAIYVASDNPDLSRLGDSLARTGEAVMQTGLQNVKDFSLEAVAAEYAQLLEGCAVTGNPTIRDTRRGQNLAKAPRVLYVVSHAIQYQVPLLRFIESSGAVSVHTALLRDSKATAFDPGFGQLVAWDNDMTSGFSHEVLHGFATDAWSRTRPIHRGLLRLIRTTRPSAVWLHGYDHVTQLRIIALCRALRIPVLVRSEVEPMSAEGSAAARRAKDIVLRLLYRQVSHFLTVGTRNEEFYRSRGVSDARMTRVPYSVDNDYFHRLAPPYQQAKRQLSESHGVDAARPALLFVGKLIDRKRPADILDAVALLPPDRRPDVWLAGDGQLRASLQERASSLGLAGSVHFLGFQNQSALPLLYAAADLTILSSENERWGLVVNESLACGTPVVTTDVVGCVEDLVRPGLGLTYPVGDISALASCLTQFLEQPKTEERVLAAQRLADTCSYAQDLKGIIDALAKVGSV